MWIVTLITVYHDGLCFCLKAFENLPDLKADD